MRAGAVGSVIEHRWLKPGALDVILAILPAYPFPLFHQICLYFQLRQHVRAVCLSLYTLKDHPKDACFAFISCSVSSWLDVLANRMLFVCSCFLFLCYNEAIQVKSW